MSRLRVTYMNATGWLMRKAGTARAGYLHHLYIMQAQDDVPFPWYERALLNAQIWALDRVCGPITD